MRCSWSVKQHTRVPFQHGSTTAPLRGTFVFFSRRLSILCTLGSLSVTDVILSSGFPLPTLRFFTFSDLLDKQTSALNSLAICSNFFVEKVKGIFFIMAEVSWMFSIVTKTFFYFCFVLSRGVRCSSMLTLVRNGMSVVNELVIKYLPAISIATVIYQSGRNFCFLSDSKWLRMRLPTLLLPINL